MPLLRVSCLLVKIEELHFSQNVPRQIFKLFKYDCGTPSLLRNDQLSVGQFSPWVRFQGQFEGKTEMATDALITSIAYHGIQSQDLQFPWWIAYIVSYFLTFITLTCAFNKFDKAQIQSRTMFYYPLRARHGNKGKLWHR